MSNLAQLTQLLKKTSKKKSHASEYFTHCSTVEPKGKYQIEMGDLETFWSLYSSVLKDGVSVSLAENGQFYTAAIFDVDLVGHEQKPLYTFEQVLETIRIIVDKFRATLELKNEQVLTCVLLEKPGYWRDDQYRNGYHLHFPALFVKKDWFAKVFLAELGEIAGLDKMSGSVTWLMYGSRRYKDMPPYSARAVIVDGQTVPLSTLAKFPLFNSFGHVMTVPQDAVEYYLPRILSIDPMYRETTPIKSAPIFRTIAALRTVPNPIGEINVESLETACKLLEMLSPERAANFDPWIKTGWILHSVSGGSDEGLAAWLNWSKKCPEKYNEVDAVDKWDKMGTRYGLGLGTLFFWAKQDSPVLCEAFKEQRRENFLRHNNLSNHFSIAKFIKQEVAHEFVCVNIKKGFWYQCVAGLWQYLDDPYTLRTRISEEFAPQFKKILSKKSAKDDEELPAKIAKMDNNLKNSAYKKSIISELADLMYEPNFLSKLDMNKHLIGFKNGVYDLNLNEFRPFESQDHISKTLPISYKKYAHDDPVYLSMLNFLSKIFPDANVRKYFVDIYCEVFFGANLFKQIHFWTGFGDNGKTVTQTLFERMLGSLSIKLPTKIFSGEKYSAGAAAPELARAAPPVRLVTLEEPDAKESFNIGYLKQFSGNDSIWARDLYAIGRETTEFVPFFKIVIICNNLPAIKNADEATFNRIRVIPFEATFKNDAPATEEEQRARKIFPKNSRIIEELPQIAGAFAYYLLEWRKNKTGDIVEPFKVVSATTEYKQKNDMYYYFINEMLILGDKDKPALGEREIFNLLKVWCKGRRNCVPDQAEFLRYFKSKWGENTQDWPHISEANFQEQVKSGQVIILNK